MIILQSTDNNINVPDYVIDVLKEDWESLKGCSIDEAIFCKYSLYRQVLKKFNKENEGLPHINMSLDILESEILNVNCEFNKKVRKRTLNLNILNNALAKWDRKDDALYVVIVVNSHVTN